MVAYVFPGQGSQSVGMGKEVFPEFPDLVAQASQQLGYSIVDLCLSDSEQKLNETQYTQPALYVVNALSFLKKSQTDGVVPQFLAGHSLGEYNALFAAQVFDFLTGLQLVQKRGELMSQARGGGMAAIIGMSEDRLQQILQQHQLTSVSVANYNSYQQLVLTGLREDIDKTHRVFEQIEGVRCIPLKTSGAFHSSYLLGAQQQFSEYCKSFNFVAPKIPVIANVTAQPYPDRNIANLLVEQIVKPVRWVDSIEYLLAQGETDFQEIGPGKVLTGLIRRILKKQ